MIPIHIRLLNKINPLLLWKLYSYRSKKIIDRSYLILSFDCDTEEDIKCIEDVHKRLKDIGITPVYAVPGELLKKGENVYKKLCEQGSEFINHGGRSHTYFDDKNNRHASCFFYDKQPLSILEEDILDGHNTLKNVLGLTAEGFRTPHFGTFQNENHIKFLYSVLKKLEYKFSTSTTPSKAYEYGPIYEKYGINEIPVSGIFNEPLNIMDTWAYFASPEKTKYPHEYTDSSKKISEFSNDNSLIINIYGDPSHICNSKEFFESMQILSKNAININYKKLLDITNENIRSI